MTKASIYRALACLMLLPSVVQAEALKAELFMPGDKSWEGSVVGRDGDWIEFKTASSANPIRIGASTIKELVFDIGLDREKLNQMNHDREYARVIAALERALEPYGLYSDIASNLTEFNKLLMELYYKVGDYEKSIELAGRIASDDRDPELQEQARIYHALSLIELERADEAQQLLAAYGWTEADLTRESAPEKIYITAKLQALQGNYKQAMELVAKVIAFYSQEPEWLQPAELLCAQVYTELGMYESAESVIEQISMLYRGSAEEEKAQALKIKIEKLRAEQELAESLDEEA